MYSLYSRSGTTTSFIFGSLRAAYPISKSRVTTKCSFDAFSALRIIESLKAVADLGTSDLIQRLGSNFARGHKEASGGIVNSAEFEELCILMKIGEKPDKVEGETPKNKVEKPAQKNTLNNYFKKF